MGFSGREASPTGGVREAGEWRRGWAILAMAFACWTTGFFAVRAWALVHGGHILPWDSSWYAKIATDGYHFDGDLMRQHPVAFLPLFPLLVRAVLSLGVSIQAAVLAVAFLSTAGGVLLLHDALASRFGPVRSAVGCALVIASPFSIYFLNGYSESLYLLFFGAFWWALFRREDLVLAALCAGLACAVRPFGLVLAAVWLCALGLRVHRGSLSWRSAALLAAAYLPLAAGGLLLVSLFYYVKFGDLALYRNAMMGWSRDLVDGLGPQPLALLAGRLQGAFHVELGSLLSFPPNFARVLLWSFVLLLPVVARRLPLEIALYGCGLMLFCIAVTTTGVDLGRHLATNVALPLGALALVWPARAATSSAAIGVGRLALVGFLFCAGLVVQALFSMRYFHGQWVS